MASRLSRYLAGVMEAGWLAAVLAVPLFFNVHSVRIFEPDKLALLRSIALLILAAWVGKAFAEGSPGRSSIRAMMGSWGDWLRRPLIAPVLGLILLTGISTALSIAPWISLLGSYHRLQGAYTAMAYNVVFVAIAVHMRRPAQVRRLVTLAILVSLPVGLYGTLQRYGIDPIPWGGDVTERVNSSMGNSIFLAAYLIMANALTLGRLLESFEDLTRSVANTDLHLARTTLYGFIAGIQWVAIVMSGSRGPMIGWLVGATLLLVLVSWRRGSRRMTIGVVAAAVALGGFLGLLNVPDGPLRELRGTSGLGRLGRIFETSTGTGRVRALIWSGAADLFTSSAPLEFPDGTKDPFRGLRPLIGYGPETMQMAFNPFYPPELGRLEARNASPDRSHNETWDALINTGALGLFLSQWLFGALFYCSLSWLGLIKTKKQRRLFFASYLGGGAIVAASLALWQGVGFLGVGLPMGFVLGMMAYVCYAALRPDSGRLERPRESLRSLILISLLAAIVMHYVEIHFGIATASTRTYFWVFAAVTYVVGHRMSPVGALTGASDRILEAEQLADSHGTRRAQGGRKERWRGQRRLPRRARPRWTRETRISAAILGLILVTMGHDFLIAATRSRTLGEVIATSFGRSPSQAEPTFYGVLAMLLACWLAGAMLLAAEVHRTGGGIDLRRVGTILGLSAGGGLLFWLWHSSRLLEFVNLVASRSTDAAGLSARYEGLLTNFYLAGLAGILVLGWLLSAGRSAAPKSRSWVGILVVPVVATSAIVLANVSNLKLIQADMAQKIAEQSSEAGDSQAAVVLQRRATQLAPHEDQYHLHLGRVLLQAGWSVEDSQSRESYFEEAEQSLQEAQRLSPLNTDHAANLARFYTSWAAGSVRNDRVQELLASAEAHYRIAVRLSPNDAELWAEWGSFYLAGPLAPEEALAPLLQAVEVDPLYAPSHQLLGDAYVAISEGAEDPGAARQALVRAALSYQEALHITPPLASQGRLNTQLALGQVYVALGEWEAAISTLEAAMQSSPPGSEVWRIEEKLAALYFGSGNQVAATWYAESALAAAPDSERGRLESLLADLRSGP